MRTGSVVHWILERVGLKQVQQTICSPTSSGGQKPTPTFRRYDQPVRLSTSIFALVERSTTMVSQGAAPLSFSKVPGNPSFRKKAVNAVALVPLLAGNDNKGDGADTTSSKSLASFATLLESLRRHGTAAPQVVAEDELLLVIPNSSLTRPGDWRYNETPLKAFHWQHGCQRLMLFDGRPQESRPAHDRLINQSVTRDWIDLCPSRRTAAVVGVLNLHDCESLEDLHRAEEELHQVRTQTSKSLPQHYTMIIRRDNSSQN